MKTVLKRSVACLLSIIILTALHPTAAYASRIVLSCGREEHQHTASCYELLLSCGKKEAEGHTHTDLCYKETRSLICGLEEKEAVEGHSHTDICFDEAGELVCGRDEREPVPGHRHTDACYETKTELCCGKSECEAHAHTTACYSRGKDPICGKKEHTHGDGCYSDHAAGVESVELWDQEFAEFEYTGDWGEDLLNVAMSQLGIKESRRNFYIDSEGNKSGYVRYNQWYNEFVYTHLDSKAKELHFYDMWCANFVCFSLYYARIPREATTWRNNCQKWINQMKELGIFVDAPSDYTPSPGDIIFFDWRRDGKADHVGIVKAVDEEKVYTVEGNSNNQVRECHYQAKANCIVGYGSLSLARDLYEQKIRATKQFSSEQPDKKYPYDARKSVKAPESHAMR